MLNNKRILITGGTGSFGNKFVERIFNNFTPEKVIVYSRDEYKQFIMRQKFLKFDKRFNINKVYLWTMIFVIACFIIVLFTL